MSRYSHTLRINPTITLNYGSDHKLGFWYDVFDEETEEEIEAKCSLFDKLTSDDLASLLLTKIQRPSGKHVDHIIKLRLGHEI